MVDVNLSKAFFLDRDGVINEPIIKNNLPLSPMRVSDFRFIDGVLEVASYLKKIGYKLFVVTNQPEISRGNLEISEVEKMNELILRHLPIDEIYVCPHDDDAGCGCRKPKPGALHYLAIKHKINLRESYMIGDRWKDVIAGHAAGCKTIFIDRKYAEKPIADCDVTIGRVLDCINLVRQ